MLLLCAGMELDAQFAGLCAKASGDTSRTVADVQPGTGGTAGAALERNHTERAVASLAADRIDNQPGVPLTLTQLRIDERVLHYLTGLQHLDERLSGYDRADLERRRTRAHRNKELARTISLAWSRANSELPLVTDLPAPMNSPDATSRLPVVRAPDCTASRSARK